MDDRYCKNGAIKGDCREDNVDYITYEERRMSPNKISQDGQRLSFKWKHSLLERKKSIQNEFP